MCDGVPGCETCRILFRSLEDAKAKFVLAISQIPLTGRGMHKEFQAAWRDAESLRIECRHIGAELERHQAEQHSQSFPR
jgi:hypothetical protein